MTENERSVRLEVGAEIIEGVVLDFLNEHRDSAFSSAGVSAALEFEYWMCHGALLRLRNQRRIKDERPSSRGPHRWRAHA